MLITFAKCCRPIPGDPIIAHVSPGKGLVIHHESCRNIRGYQKEPEKFMAVEWDKETAQEFITEIKVDMFNHQGATGESYRGDQHRFFQYSKPEYGRERWPRLQRLYSPYRARPRASGEYHAQIRVMPDVIKVTRNRN